MLELLCLLVPEMIAEEPFSVWKKTDFDNFSAKEEEIALFCRKYFVSQYQKT